MKLINNIEELLIDDLKQEISKKSRVSIAAASFSIYAFEALKKELKSIDELRFIFTSPTFIEESFKKKSREFYIPHIYNEHHLCGGEFELRLRNELTQRSIAKECSKWVKDKVTFKTNKHSNLPLHGLIHLEKSKEDQISYSNINGFTTNDLGLTPSPGFPTLVQKTQYPNAKAFLDWFDQIWKNENNLQDVTEKVQACFENAYKDNSPEFIYFITLYNIFNDFLDDLSLDALPDDQIGFKDTLIWNKLYNFQKDAVIGAINKLEKYKGCILADSVGLGKTFSALGVIKYYEKRNKDVLVLCPKKLEANWNTFRQNDTNNFLAKDKFRYDVLFHTDLSREKGMSNGRNLELVNWGNYGLVVIDESHNFRNNNTVVDKENRYQRLQRRIVQEGIETKVLMLSATPVNNRFNDLRNQLALAYEGDSIDINEKLDTDRNIDQIFRRAQTSFNEWSRLDSEERTTETLLELLDFDFFKILDNLTIARSRKHITTYYDTTEIGQFPHRNIPISIQSPLSEDKSINYTDIAEKLTLLNLSVYSPLSYLLASKVPVYAALYDRKVKFGAGKFSQIDRETSLKILMRINLLKRIESSVAAFRITVQNIIDLIQGSIDTIENSNVDTYSGLQLDISSGEDIEWEPHWGDDQNVIGKKVKVHVADMDKRKWKEDLSSDLFVLQNILDQIDVVRGDQDLKLSNLKSLISEKINNPINDGNKKIIIFTAFADTANYLYEELVHFSKEEFWIETALITGSKKTSTIKKLGTDLNALLSCFSPKSKDKNILYPKIKAEIDLLIATDCISEGQNLQDCDFLVNYDIHWNPVRIIQRFGRIDRIGSQNASITMANFWPDMNLDSYINLKQRVENRMLISNMASTGDDNILDQEAKDLDYRKKQLEKLQSEVIDLEDLKEGVSITDLGLNDFRVDLANYIKTYGALKHIPESLHALVKAEDGLQKGIIYVLKNINTTVNIDKLNRLHPYYMVYIGLEGNIVHTHLEPKKILDVVRYVSKGKLEPNKVLCDHFSKETNDYCDMELYSELLKKAISSILHTEEEKDILSLFKSGGTTALGSDIKGIEDFVLVSFIALL